MGEWSDAMADGVICEGCACPGDTETCGCPESREILRKRGVGGDVPAHEAEMDAMKKRYREWTKDK